MYIHIYVHVHVYIYTYIHAYTYAHTYLYTDMYIHRHKTFWNVILIFAITTHNNYGADFCEYFFVRKRCTTNPLCCWYQFSNVSFLLNFLEKIVLELTSENFHKIFLGKKKATRITGEEIPTGVVAIITPDAVDVLSHVSVHCNTLQHTATHCYTLLHTATHCKAMQYTANTPQIHCNSVQAWLIYSYAR